MRTKFVIAYCILFAATLGLFPCFAQEAPPERLAVYVSGASDAGVNKSLGSKLLAAMSQGGAYAEIPDPAVFQDELAKGGKSDIASIAQVAKRHGADYVCVVSITEVFGAHSITARLVQISDSQVAKTGFADRALKSLEDLAAVSNELARQLLPPSTAAVPPPIVFAAPPPDAAAPPPFPEAAPPAPVAAQKQCAKTYNINELLFKIKDSFPAQLKDCSSALAKDMLTPASFGGKKLEPKSFMMQCPIDGVKKELPEGFPNVDKIIGSVANFVQGIMNTAISGGALDPKKLLSAVGSMDVGQLLNDVRGLASAECVVDEPYEPPIASAVSGGNQDSEKDAEKSSVSFGIRIGGNFSHTYAEAEIHSYGGKSGAYDDVLGMQAGFVLDIAATDVFRIQPGLMYIQKGMSDGNKDYTAHHIEFPLLFSLKLAVLRLNAGPYVGLCLSGDEVAGCVDFDFGVSTGFGFDIGMFYIGMFYDYGLLGARDNRYGYDMDYFNRTLGFNLGINL
ncbi:hypothetical protein R83H12_01287 [Fibrobacteria bacterium R8-3-H12]